MREAINERVVGREKSPNRRWTQLADEVWTEAVWGTAILMKVKEKRARMRRNKHKLIQVRWSIVWNGSQTSSLGKAIRDLRLFTRKGTHNLRSKPYIFNR